MTSEATHTKTTLPALLAVQHARVRAMFQDATTAEGVERSIAFDRLARYLAIHEAAEQVALHGQGVRLLGEHAAVSQARLTEEREASAMVERLFSLDPEDFAFGVQLGLLEEAVVRHAQAEESVELPAVLIAMDADDIRAAEATLSLVDDVFDQDPDEGPVSPRLTFAEQHRAAVALFEERIERGVTGG